MRCKIAFASAACLLASTPAPAAQAPLGAKDVTVSAIPGVVAAGAKWRIFWSGPDNADGIVGTADGGVIFAQREVNRVRKVDPDGKSSVVVENTNGAGALAIDYQGRIIGMLRDHPSVAYLTPERKLLTDNYQGVSLKGASDVVVEKKGGMYFTESRRMPTPGAYYLGPDGKMFFFGDGRRANGLALSPDEKTLYLPNRDMIEAFDILPDGTGTNRREFAKLQPGSNADGMAVDAEGRIYSSGRVGIQVVSPKGEYLGLIPTPRASTSVAFSGPDKKRLYVIGVGAVDAAGKEMPDEHAKTIYELPMLAQGYKGRAK